MKTIAIDDATSKLLDQLASRSARRQSRSAVVRAALRQYAARGRRRDGGSEDSAIFRKHRKRIARQVRALIAEQARS